jgi:hypothetical protein
MGEARRREASRPGAPVAPGSNDPDLDWNRMLAPPIAPGKSCGSCTKCCKVLAIPELRKRPFHECVHVAPGLGCKIYPQRPESCRKFICGWLLDPNMGPDLKPENCHVVFYQRDRQNIVAICDADYPDSWRKPNVTEFLHYLARTIAPHRVILAEKGRTWLVTESAIVPADTG